MSRRTRTIAAVVVVVLGGAVARGLSAAGDDRDPVARATRPTPTPTGSPVPVLLPGRPGEPASVLPPGQRPPGQRPPGHRPPGQRPPAGGVGHNPLDAWFVQMMIPHHRQALDLAALAPGRASDPRIRAIAARITAAQGPEIAVLRSWLRQRGLTEAGKHDHGPASGMHPPEAIRALAATSGAAFDRSFVDLMSTHHRGAIHMCIRVLTGGADDGIQQIATNIAAEQQIEIGRMREIIGR
jgi:uncharacterized protein (DUF305 family)